MYRAYLEPTQQIWSTLAHNEIAHEPQKDISAVSEDVEARNLAIKRLKRKNLRKKEAGKKNISKRR